MPQQVQEPNENLLAQIVVPLLQWYDAHARILPWRENTEPYAVWVSEIMLQQTRVEAVKPYYERFMKALPTVQSLAKVKEDDLLKLWEGLGYYTRARNLKKAAQIICDQYHGVFPRTYEQILLLPGVGAYTAGAIASICFGLPTPAVDGNVMRVLSRLTENGGNIASTTTKQQITQQLCSIYPAHRSGDFTQSVMELGAVICTPNGFPKCEHCPLKHLCKAYLHQTQLQFPVKAKKMPRKQEQKTVFLLCFQDKIAIRKRQQQLLLGGLWELPNCNGTPSNEEVLQWLKGHGVLAESMMLAGAEKHVFTHVEWRMRVCRVQSFPCNIDDSPFLWVNKDTLQNQIALPTAFKKLLKYW